MTHQTASSSETLSWIVIGAIFLSISGLWYGKQKFMHPETQPSLSRALPLDAAPPAPLPRVHASALPGTASFFPEIFVLLFLVLIYFAAYRDWIDRTLLFVLGAAGLTFCGTHLHFTDWGMAWKSLWDKADVLCFLVGMNMITVILAQGGLFDTLAKKIALSAKGAPWGILLWFCLMTYLLSLLVNNLTTMLILIPMVLSLSRAMDFDPKIPLIGMVVASNLGGASTMVGDFPNMLIGTETGIPFVKFLIFMLPICVVELLILIVYLGATQKGFCAKEGAPGIAPSELKRRFMEKIKRDVKAGPRNPRVVRRGLLILGLLIVGFLLSDALHCPPWIMALAGGLLALGWAGCKPVEVLRELDIKDIFFFSGLFVLAGAVEASGLLTGVKEIIVHLSFGNPLAQCLILMWLAALATAFLNAGPSTALFMPLVMGLGLTAPHHLVWWSLSLGVLAGSSATLTGATAGSVASTMLADFKSREEQTLSFRGYASVGVPLALIFLLVSSVYVTVIYNMI